MVDVPVWIQNAGVVALSPAQIAELESLRRKAAQLDELKSKAHLVAEDLAGARATLAALETLGISLPAVTDELEREGVDAFADAFTGLLDAVEARRRAVSA